MQGVEHMAIGYQLKITIMGSKPPIWRRVIVPEHIAFYDLDDIIEKIFGWTHSHLYEFFIKDWGMRITGAPLMEEEDNADECIDSWMKVGSEIIYTYDFGDSWEHLIKIEKVVEYEYRYPIVLKSKGPNMIEDCGGIWGFYDCMEEAEPFDMEAVNEELRSWVLPVAESMEELMGLLGDEEEDFELDGFIDDIDDEFFDEEELKEAIIHEDNYVRHTFGNLESLEDVYIQFSKENLVEIAKSHGFRGYSKFGKQRLIEWLITNMLEKEYFQNYILHADIDEIKVFEAAIEENGIYLSEEMMYRSLFLSSYGGFLPYYNFYHVPKDVQEKYKEYMTDEIRAKRVWEQYFYDVCHSTVYLYGVLSIRDLTNIYNHYVKEQSSEAEIRKKVYELISRDDIFAIKNDYLMDERLIEDDLYMEVLKEQEKVERYVPEEKEVFLAFGRAGVQEPDNDTKFFVEYLMKEANLDYSHAALAFYLMQEAIRMNQDEMELLGILSDLGVSLNRKKQFDKAEQMIRKISNRTRKWDYNGHTWMELNAGVVEFKVERRRK